MRTQNVIIRLKEILSQNIKPNIKQKGLVAGGESVSVLPFWSQSSRGWGSATALEVKKKVASQTAIRSSKELDF